MLRHNIARSNPNSVFPQRLFMRSFTPNRKIPIGQNHRNATGTAAPCAARKYAIRKNLLAQKQDYCVSCPSARDISARKQKKAPQKRIERRKERSAYRVNGAPKKVARAATAARILWLLSGKYSILFPVTQPGAVLGQTRPIKNLCGDTMIEKGEKEMFIAVTFILFTVLVAVVSWWKTRGDSLDSKDGYFLAGRSLTGPVIAGSLMLTNLSTEQLVGQAGQSYATNMGPMAWDGTSCIGLLMLAFLFLPKYLKMGITTVPEFLEQRYDTMLKRIVSFLFLLGYLLTYLPTVLYSGALVFNQIFGIDQIFGITQFQGVILTAFAIGVIGAIYAIFGGLKAVAVSDTVNGLGLLIGGIALPIFALVAFGHGSFVQGVHDFVNLLPPEKFNAINPAGAQAPMVPWPVLLTGMVINNMFYWTTNQAIIQRTLGARNLKEAQKGAIFAAILKLTNPLFITLGGLLTFFMAHNGWLSADRVAALAANSDLAYPTLILEIMPKPLLGFFAAVLFGAILSSFNSALNSSVTLYTLDLHRPLFNPHASDSHLVKVGKRFGIILAAVSICVAPVVSFAPSGLYDFLQECFGFYNAPILAAVVIGLYTKRVPSIAPKIGLIMHVVLYGFSKTPLFKSVFPYHYLYVLFTLFVLNVVVQLLIGKFWPRETPYVMADAQVVDMTPWKHSRKIAVICCVLMLVMYAVFSPLGLAAA